MTDDDIQLYRDFRKGFPMITPSQKWRDVFCLHVIPPKKLIFNRYLVQVRCPWILMIFRILGQFLRHLRLDLSLIFKDPGLKLSKISILQFRRKYLRAVSFPRMGLFREEISESLICWSGAESYCAPIVASQAGKGFEGGVTNFFIRGHRDFGLSGMIVQGDRSLPLQRSRIDGFISSFWKDGQGGTRIGDPISSAILMIEFIVGLLGNLSKITFDLQSVLINGIVRTSGHSL
jgi:hypothetical protein